MTTLLYMLLSFFVQIGNGLGASSLRLFDLSGSVRYVGTAMYAFEGIAMLLPIEHAMAEPDRCAEVVCWTMGASCLLQVGFACAAYARYVPRHCHVTATSHH